MRTRLAIAVGCLLVAAGCPPGGPGTDGGPGPDATVDAATDAGPGSEDAGLDATAPVPDASADAGPDAGPDAAGEEDGGLDVPPDCEPAADLAVAADPAGQVLGAAAAARSGGFAVAFSVADGVGTFVRARLLDECGLPAGDEIEVDESGLVVGVPVASAVGETGGFVIAWSRDGGPGDDEGAAVVFRRFDGDGTPAGALTLASEVTFDDQLATAAAALSTGFALAWEDNSGGALIRPDAVLCTFDEAGRPMSGEVSMSPLPDGAQNVPRMAVAADGSLLAAWVDEGVGRFRRRNDGGWLDAEAIALTDDGALPSSAAGTEDGFGIALTSYSADLEGDVLLSVLPSGGGEAAEATIAERQGAERDAIVVSTRAGFLIAWTDETYRDDPQAVDSSGSTVGAVWTDAAGEVEGEPFVVPTTTDFDQELAAGAAGPGGVLVVWVDWSRADGEDDGGLRSRLITWGEGP
ncbi:MAG: hypothetical protein HYY06_23605 [Deltaproteobacteria bacterium]|nr:hypothetical protein [Deltaproteobacteria bacterium]